MADNVDARDVVSLAGLVEEQLGAARQAHAGRSAHTVYGGHEATLRQTLIALTAGTRLSEHESPGDATVQVLAGRVRVSAGDESWEAATGELLVIPPLRHDLEALDDSAVLLTVGLHR